MQNEGCQWEARLKAAIEGAQEARHEYNDATVTLRRAGRRRWSPASRRYSRLP